MTQLRLSNLVALATLALAATASPSLRAEVNEIRISKQYGLPYIQFVIMEDQKLIEKHAKLQGLTDLKVEWSNVKVYVTAKAPGTQFTADMTYSETIDGVSCTAKYRAVGIWPVVDCGVYEYDDL